MKTTIAVFYLSLSLVFGAQVVAAQSQTATTSQPAVSEPDPGVLPTNPFYFLKELGRGLKSFFIFDPVAKLQYQSDITDEKASELQKVIEFSPDNAKAIDRAITNYNDNVAKLKTQLDSLKTNSNNPNVQKLLSQLNERALRHQQLFENLKSKEIDFADKLEAAKNRLLDDVIGNIKEKTGGALATGATEVKSLPKASQKVEVRTVQVTITDDGFSPKEIKIKKGDTVVWTNQSSAASWPASAMHPTHTVYPGSNIEKCGTSEDKNILDACRGLMTGEGFKFTFNIKGSWNYHDHLKSSSFGKIVVE